MENLSKKVGFLKGLMEGMRFDGDGGAQGKLLSGIVELLSDLSDRVEAMDELLDDLNDYVESIDEDLTELEGARDDELEDYFDDDDEEEDFDDVFDGGEDKLHLLRPARDAEPEDDSLAGNLCPKCSRMFFTSLKDADDSEYVCPHCGERVKPVALTPDNAPIAKPTAKE